jgi:tetratricopeptide (TPR) repeat protein
LGDEERLQKSLNAVFETAYDCLPEELKEAFRTLALFNEGASFDTAAFAATAGLAAAEAGGRLHRLAGRSLLERVGAGRWSLHTLLRAFAAGLPAVDEEVWLGFAGHYAGVLRVANQLYKQGGEDVMRGLALYDREGPHIRAGQAWAAGRAAEDEEAARLCSDYPYVGTYVLHLRLRPRTLLRWLEAAADAAHRLGDKEAEGRHLGNLGLTYARLGETRRAIDYYRQALAIAREIRGASTEGSPQWADARRGEGTRLGNLGLAYARLGETRRAIDYHRQALAIAREIRARFASTEGSPAWADARRGEGNQLGNLGLAYARLGETRRAIDYYEQALAIACEIGDRRGEGNHLANLGTTYAALDEPARAREYWAQALTLLEAIEDPNAERVRGWLGALEA